MLDNGSHVGLLLQEADQRAAARNNHPTSSPTKIASVPNLMDLIAQTAF
jgi:hypothetical protein